MENWSWQQRWRYGVVQAVGLGWIVGAFEVVSLVASLNLPLGVPEALVVGLVDALVMGGVAVAAASLSGLLHPALMDRRPSRAIAWQLGAAAGALAAAYLWPLALARLELDEPVGAAAMLVLPLGFLGVTYFNARYWLARVELGRDVAVGWLPAAGGLSAVVVAGCALAWGLRAPGGGFALEGDASVLLVTIDGMGLEEATDAEALQALAAASVSFSNAVTPSPASGPASASALTGLHPLRNRVLFDEDPFLLGLPTLQDVLMKEGYATGGFVSSRSVRGSLGYSQGFSSFDDDFSPVAGVMHIRLLTHLVDAAVTSGTAPEFLARRDPERTAERFEAWHEAVEDEVWFAWVHLAGSPTECDAALARLLARLDETDGPRPMIVVAGAGGPVDAEGLPGALADRSVRVPLVVDAEGLEGGATIAAQVRLMDVTATILDYLELDPIGASEGVSLLPYARGEQRGTIWTALVWGSPEEVWFGMRNNGLKYVERGEHAGLWNVVDDPDEQHDLSDFQDEAVSSAKRLLSSERAALERLVESR